MNVRGVPCQSDKEGSLPVRTALAAIPIHSPPVAYFLPALFFHNARSRAYNTQGSKVRANGGGQLALPWLLQVGPSGNAQLAG